MKPNFSIDGFSAYLFWDKDRFDFEKYKSQLIYKVIEYGQLQDWKNLVDLSGKEVIKEVALVFKSMNAVAVSILSNYFKIEKGKFRCYTRAVKIELLVLLENYMNEPVF